VIRMMQNVDTPGAGGSMGHGHRLPDQEFSLSDPRPAAVVVPGPVEAVIKEWPVPTQGSRPPRSSRDQGRRHLVDRAIGQHFGFGWTRQTGQSKEYVLKTSHTGPHGLTEDQDGNIWFTGNSASLIGKLDPKTGEATEYRMPNPEAKDPAHPHLRSRWHPLVHRAAGQHGGSPRPRDPAPLRL